MSEHNAERSEMNDHRNGTMTNAERQKRYRDKKRGGPPRGRWAGHVPAKQRAEFGGTSRTMLFMAKWICEHAPDIGNDIYEGKLKVIPEYHRLRLELDRTITKAIKHAKQNGIDVDELEIFRRHGEFVFEHCPER